MRLFRVEVRRLLARRIFRFAVVALLLIIAGTLGKTAYDSHPPAPAELAAARAQAAEIGADIGKERARCERQQERRNEDFSCEQIRAPAPEELLGERRFQFAFQAPGLTLGFAGFLAVVGLLLGATYIGADWAAGTMGGLLLWQPRRLVVVAAKAAALATVMAAVAAGALLAWVGGHYLVGQLRGDMEGTTVGLLTSVGLTGLRGVVLAAGAALLGLAVAGTIRFTAAALGLAFAYSVGAELIIRGLWRGAGPWLLSSNVGSWLSYGLDITDFECSDLTGNCTPRTVHISFAHSATYLAVGLAVALAVFALSFRQRDVT